MGLKSSLLGLLLLHWLSPVPFSKHYGSFSEIRLKTTGDWLLSHPGYMDFNRSTSSSLLLIHVARRFVKTILAAAFVGSGLEHTAKKTQHEPVACFYCANNDVFEPERSESDDILRSLVRRHTFRIETQRNIHEGLAIEHEQPEAETKLDGFDMPRLHWTECIKLISENTALNPLVLIVDAIDEVEDGRRHNLTLYRWLK